MPAARIGRPADRETRTRRCRRWSSSGPATLRATLVSVTRTRRAGRFVSPATNTVPEIDAVPRAHGARLSRGRLLLSDARRRRPRSRRPATTSTGRSLDAPDREDRAFFGVSPAATVSLVARLASASSLFGSCQPSTSAAFDGDQVVVARRQVIERIDAGLPSCSRSSGCAATRRSRVHRCGSTGKARTTAVALGAPRASFTVPDTFDGRSV